MFGDESVPGQSLTRFLLLIRDLHNGQERIAVDDFLHQERFDRYLKHAIMLLKVEFCWARIKSKAAGLNATKILRALLKVSSM